VRRCGSTEAGHAKGVLALHTTDPHAMAPPATVSSSSSTMGPAVWSSGSYVYDGAGTGSWAEDDVYRDGLLLAAETGT
jgi:hypothetical protein